jgi:hypothetical protein
VTWLIGLRQFLRPQHDLFLKRRAFRLQIFGHVVESFAQLREFIGARDGDPVIQLSGSDSRCA